MLRPSIEAMVETMEAKGYCIYDTPTVDWNLNIVGIRSAPTAERPFDDTLVVFQRFYGSWEISYYDITTDPGRLRPRRFADAAEVAILEEGQYRGAYKLDLHTREPGSTHLALCQNLGAVTVCRAGGRDGRGEPAHERIETGMFGVDIHRTHGSRAGARDVTCSAGCQVFADSRKFAEFMAKCREGAKAFGNKFTYTLLHERDFA